MDLIFKAGLHAQQAELDQNPLFSIKKTFEKFKG